MQVSVFNASSAASDLGLHCLPMSFLWDARHKWIECLLSKHCLFHFSCTILSFQKYDDLLSRLTFTLYVYCIYSIYATSVLLSILVRKLELLHFTVCKCVKYCCMSSKQCSIWSDIAFCVVWSKSSLCFSGLPVQKLRIKTVSYLKPVCVIECEVLRFQEEASKIVRILTIFPRFIRWKKPHFRAANNLVNEPSERRFDQYYVQKMISGFQICNIRINQSHEKWCK